MIPEYESWKTVQELGSGAFGSVYEIQREDFGHIYKAALKVITIPNNKGELESLRSTGMDDKSISDYYHSFAAEIVKEFDVMTKLKGTTNIVSYEDHVTRQHEDGLGWDIMIRMELLTPLNRYISENKGKFTRRNIIRLGIDLCSALERCQKFNIIHRDIKPDNIFVSEQGDFKLGDFCIERAIDQKMAGLKRGFQSYTPPEVYKGQEYGYSVDIYSLGLVMYRLLNNNRLPFMPPYPEPITYPAQQQAMVRRMSGEPFPLPCLDQTRLGEIVLKACSYEPENRYSSPTMMKKDLQAILYTEREQSEFIQGDDEIPTPSVDRTLTSGDDLSAEQETVSAVEEGTVAAVRGRALIRGEVQKPAPANRNLFSQLTNNEQPSESKKPLRFSLLKRIFLVPWDKNKDNGEKRKKNSTKKKNLRE